MNPRAPSPETAVSSQDSGTGFLSPLIRRKFERMRRDGSNLGGGGIPPSEQPNVRREDFRRGVWDEGGMSGGRREIRRANDRKRAEKRGERDDRTGKTKRIPEKLLNV